MGYRGFCGCGLLGGQGVFSVDLCPVGEKRVKFEEVHVYILHSPLPGGGRVSGTAFGPTTGLFDQSRAESLSVASMRESSD